jgi:hypothetical protein
MGYGNFYLCNDGIRRSGRFIQEDCVVLGVAVVRNNPYEPLGVLTNTLCKPLPSGSLGALLKHSRVVCKALDDDDYESLALCRWSEAVLQD